MNPDADFMEAVEQVATELDAKRSFRDRLRDTVDALRLLIGLSLCGWLGK